MLSLFLCALFKKKIDAILFYCNYILSILERNKFVSFPTRKESSKRVGEKHSLINAEFHMLIPFKLIKPY